MTDPTRLVLVRHAEVETNYQRVFGGRIDMGLSEAGLQQAEFLGNFLRRKVIDAFYCSPMKRVQLTIAPLLKVRPLKPVTLPGLREVDFGDWTGLTWDDVKTKFGASAFDWLLHLEKGTVPNGETGADFRARVEPCVRQILADHPNQTTVIACHGGVIRMILSILLDLPLSRTEMFEIDYASVSEVVLWPHRTEIKLLNFAPWGEEHRPNVI
jgi:broad specificity phosphatase PhoE